MRLYERYTRVILLELYGFRKWTESLGPLREWKIQDVQTEVYRTLQKVSERLGFFALPSRYDYEVILAPNAEPQDLSELLEAVKAVAPTPVRMASVCGETPRNSEKESFRSLLETSLGSFHFRKCKKPEAIALAHIDFNNITYYTEMSSPLESVMLFTEIYVKISRLAFEHGGIPAYLGGDNILVVLPPDDPTIAVSKFLDVADIKIGVGVAERAKEALKLATEALDEVRESFSKRRALVKNSLTTSERQTRL
ncbi:MAG: GTP cyclohydrolase IIa [Acidilobaceae archaeon]